jgi:hypothetical protein
MTCGQPRRMYARPFRVYEVQVTDGSIRVPA